MFPAATENLRTLRPLKVLFAVALGACALQSPALTFSNSYRSPRNPERRIRPATRLIVLHTTEAHARSSLNKLRERGEAHYCVPEDGTVYRIVDRERVAFHAGRSMWNGKEDCDEYSIGIEVVGHHDKPVTLKQIAALKELVAALKKMYSLTDGQVVCHSHVAYGAPNKWQSRRHRGRKRCGMLFAMWSVRTRMGLRTRPAYDPDVKAGRLIQADRYLGQVLYGNIDTMVSRYAGGKDPAAEKKGGLLAGLGDLFGLGADKEKPTPKSKPVAKPLPTSVPKPTQKPASKPTQKAQPKLQQPAPQASWRSTAKFVAAKDKPVEHPVMKAAPPKPDEPGNWYLMPDGRCFRDDRLPAGVKLQPGTKRLVGYCKGGPLKPGTSAYSIAGKAWDAPSTYYVMGGKVLSGDQLDSRSISSGAIIFYKK